MLDVMLNGEIALCDTGTGIGKTYAYLTAGIIFQRTAVGRVVRFTLAERGHGAGNFSGLRNTEPASEPRRFYRSVHQCQNGVLDQDGPLPEDGLSFGRPFQDLKYYKEIQDSIAAEYPGYNREGYVFCQENGQPYEPRTYQDLFKRCVRQAGIKDANFHSLRHTFATRSLEQGMDVVTLSRLLGHANPSITMDKYGHALDEHKRASIGKLGDIYSGVKKTPSKKKERER